MPTWKVGKSLFHIGTNIFYQDWLLINPITSS